MIQDREKCVAFTGYRPAKLFRHNRPADVEAEVRQALRVVVSEVYSAGKRVFLCGMAEGFDLLAAEEVINLRDEGICPEIEVAAIIPFSGSHANFDERWKESYDIVLNCATYQISLAERYHTNCYYDRNDYMVNNSSMLICYFNGESGGTKYTVAKAKKSGLPIINICNPSLFLF